MHKRSVAGLLESWAEQKVRFRWRAFNPPRQIIESSFCTWAGPDAAPSRNLYMRCFELPFYAAGCLKIIEWMELPRLFERYQNFAFPVPMLVGHASPLGTRSPEYGDLVFFKRSASEASLDHAAVSLGGDAIVTFGAGETGIGASDTMPVELTTIDQFRQRYRREAGGHVSYGAPSLW